VQPGVVGAPVLVRQRIDEAGVARDPDQRRERAGNLVGQVLAGREVLDRAVYRSEPLSSTE
jgi:hypothetical protein